MSIFGKESEESELAHSAVVNNLTGPPDLLEKTASVDRCVYQYRLDGKIDVSSQAKQLR